MVTLLIKVTDAPVITFNTIVTTVTDVDYLLWLLEGAISVSLCQHVLLYSVAFPLCLTVLSIWRRYYWNYLKSGYQYLHWYTL